MTALAADETFTLGSFNSATETFKNASGTGSNKYKTLMIAYGRTPRDGEQLVLPTEAGFVENGNAGTTCSTVINMSEGKSLGELRLIYSKFNLKTVRLMVRTSRLRLPIR